jgi:hypothetical protein
MHQDHHLQEDENKDKGFPVWALCRGSANALRDHTQVSA